VEADFTYDSGLRPATYNLKKSGDDPVMQKSYEYFKDGKLKFAEDELNGIFDRGQTYDHQGRVATGKSSTEASGTTVTSDLDINLPYRQSYAYNAFDNLTQRNNLHWGVEEWGFVSNNLSYSYANNRVSGWTYDADGRSTVAAVSGGYSYQTYDARGLLEIIDGGEVFASERCGSLGSDLRYCEILDDSRSRDSKS
jgi:hypothetical protein